MPASDSVSASDVEAALSEALKEEMQNASADA